MARQEGDRGPCTDPPVREHAEIGSESTLAKLRMRGAKCESGNAATMC